MAGMNNARPTRLDECSVHMQKMIDAADDRTRTQDIGMLVAVLECLKQTDFNIAVEIAAHANLKIRDKLGNVLGDIWTRNSTDADSATGKLTSQEDIQTYMRDMLQDHIATNKGLLLKCDNDTLCTWILGFVTSWETQYKDAPCKFDISEKILSVMSEAVQMVSLSMQDTDFDVDAIERRYSQDIKKLRDVFPVLDRDMAVVRIYFRHPTISRYMVLIAGKLLQKRECNRSGSYCSTKQRNDVTRELDRSVSDLRFRIRSLDMGKDKHMKDWLLYSLDHKRIFELSARVRLQTTPEASNASTVTADRRALKTMRAG
jgi:hypothetical protein